MSISININSQNQFQFQFQLLKKSQIRFQIQFQCKRTLRFKLNVFLNSNEILNFTFNFNLNFTSGDGGCCANASRPRITAGNPNKTIPTLPQPRTRPAPCIPPINPCTPPTRPHNHAPHQPRSTQSSRLTPPRTQSETTIYCDSTTSAAHLRALTAFQPCPSVFMSSQSLRATSHLNCYS